MTKPSNKALNQSDRTALMDFAKNNISCPAEEAVFNDAYKAARAIVLAVVRAKYPVKDMKVLAIYGATMPDDCIRYGGYYDADSTFKFIDKDKAFAPLVPKIGGSCSNRTYDWTPEQRKVLAAYQLAREALDKAIKEKTSMYWRLVTGARMFNDVVEVWPAAEKLRTQIIPEPPRQRALAVLSADAIAAIRADNAGASERKAA